jgi:anti-sigma regulatory factor (Ser/Thr protein kinase)
MTSVETHSAGFEHEALFYQGEEDFLTSLLPFVQEGVARDEDVLVALPRPRLDLVREALDEDAGAVEFVDMAEIGGNPARIISVWSAALEQRVAAGRQLRGVGEPAFSGRRPAEFVECELHELLLNRAFDAGPSWRLLCPYDEQRLPREVTRRALRTHPIHATGSDRWRSPDYRDPGPVEAFAAALPRPTDAVLRGEFGPDDVPATRRTVAQYARRCGLPDERVEVLELAASELATNSIRHGGGSGTVAMWLERGAVVVEFSDSGHVTEPLTGRLAPPLDAEGGRGVYLVNQFCDLVQLRSSPSGTTVRVTTWL